MANLFADILFAKGDGLNLNLPKYACLLFLFVIRTFLYFSLLLFQCKMKMVYNCRYRSTWENLDRHQYPFQPIKFVNSVVPSTYETEPYNNVRYQLDLKSVRRKSCKNFRVVNQVSYTREYDFMLSKDRSVQELHAVQM